MDLLRNFGKAYNEAEGGKLFLEEISPRQLHTKRATREEDESFIIRIQNANFFSPKPRRSRQGRFGHQTIFNIREVILLSTVSEDCKKT